MPDSNLPPRAGGEEKRGRKKRHNIAPKMPVKCIYFFPRNRGTSKQAENTDLELSELPELSEIEENLNEPHNEPNEPH